MKTICGTLVIIGAVVLAGTPADATAQIDPKSKKVARFLAKLRKLQNGVTGPAKVIGLVRKLTKLDPPRAKRYYKLGTLKINVAFIERKAPLLARIVVRLVENADLPRSKARSIVRVVRKIERRVIQFNEPTPTIYPS